MSRKKIVGNWLHIEYYDPSIKRNRTKATGLPNNRQGNRLFKEFQRDFDEDLRKEKKSFLNKTTADNTTLLFSTAFEKYLELKHFDAATIKNKTLARNLFIEIMGDRPISEYTKLDFLAFNKKLATTFAIPGKKKNEAGKLVKQKPTKYLSQNTQNIRTKDLHAIFQFFEEQDWIIKNHVKTIRPLKKKPLSIAYDDQVELLNFIKRNNLDLYYTIEFMLSMGYRATETTELIWEDVFLDMQTPSIRTYNKVLRDEDFTSLLETAYDILNKMNPERNKYGKAFKYKNRNSLYGTFYKAQVNLWGIKKYTLHQLRKAFITSLLEAGVPIDEVKDLARHSQIPSKLFLITIKK